MKKILLLLMTVIMMCLVTGCDDDVIEIAVVPKSLDNAIILV